MKGLVTIIIPVYAVEKYLDRCLFSVTNQTYNNLEIILVDDGSKDKSGEICDLWAKKDSRIKVIHQENLGLASARNTGLKNMSGEFVIAIDSDDYLVSNAIELLIKAIEDTKSDVAIFKFNITLNQKPIKKLPKAKALDYFVRENEDIHKEIFFSMKYQTFFWNKLYRTEVIKDIYLQDGLTCYEDIESVPRFLKVCKKAVFLNNKLLNYLVRINSLSHDASKIAKRLEILFELYKINMERYNNWYPSIGEKLHQRLTLEYILFSHDIFTKLSSSEKRKVIYREKYVKAFQENSKDFLSSPYKWYYKVMYFRLKIRLLFLKKFH